MLNVAESTREVLRTLDAKLGARIIGQEHVIRPLTRVVKRGETGVTDPRRPKGSFLFVGPTGVGKTELTLALGDEINRPLFRIDMSEFQTQESVEEMLGFGGGPARFEVAREKMGHGGILLLDEIEKAHPRVLDLLLQILDAGRVSVSGGRVVTFRSDYVVATSNIGAAQAMRAKRQNITMLQAAILGKVQQEMRPELYNRFTGRIVFRALEPEEQMQIADLIVRAVCLRLQTLGADVSVDAEGLALIKERGIDRFLGARPLRDCAEDLIEAAVSERLIAGHPPQGVLSPSADRKELVFIGSELPR